MGQHNLNEQDGEKKIRPKEWINHPFYDPDQSLYTLSIIVLDKAAIFSETVKTICMETKNLFQLPKQASISGWGSKGNYKPQLEELSKVRKTK